MPMGNKLTRTRYGIVSVATIASLTLGLGVAQARSNIPARSQAAIRAAKRKQEANGNRSIEVICAGKVSTTGSCGGGYWTDENGVKVYHSGVHGGGGQSHSHAKSYAPARRTSHSRRRFHR